MKIITTAAVAMALVSTGEAEEKSSPHHFTGNIGLFSQYVFRGLTQTNEHPALQGGFDYSHDSGIYVGTWASNVSWVTDLAPGNSVSAEWDGYGGFKKSWNEFTTDVGYLHYEYPGSYPALAPGAPKPNTDEVYASAAWKWATLKYSYAVSDLFGVPHSEGSSYLDLTLAIPLPQSFSVGLHAGRQRFAGAGNDDLYGYEDYKVSMSRSFGAGWSASLGYTHTTAKDAGYTVNGKNLGDDQCVLALSRTL